MAAVKYVLFRGIRVSAEHAVLLRAAEDEGIWFQLNSGNRSITEQTRLYNAYQAGRGVLAAYPSRNAPHIRVGNPAHALDVDTARRGNLELAEFYRRHGVPAVFNVAGEAWHMDPQSASKLRAAAKRLRDPLAGYTADEIKWIRSYDSWLRRLVNRGGRTRLQQKMKAQRKRIWRLAQPKKNGGDGKGWTALRRRRYRSLLARTR